jgi:hypothetical protein
MFCNTHFDERPLDAGGNLNAEKIKPPPLIWFDKLIKLDFDEANPSTHAANPKSPI